MSQDYTPVSWVDETTSQQGTLINAERLNQMQTAHHYADGFEEVDAIPTEDPGVAYHKVVYCTADATFYRWDGTQWTADIDEDTKHLLDQEIARATAAEGVLRTDIETEATVRAQADTALGQRITAETGAREGADTALGARIDAEAEDRAAADAQLNAQIGALNGQTIPLNAGSSTPTIQNAVAANEGAISNLTNEVDGLTQGLTQEVTDRGAADTQLAADITAEATARASAVASLQASKADKATTLAGYGITDAVTTDTAQTISGAKTFTGNVVKEAASGSIIIRSTDQTQTSPPAANRFLTYAINGSNNTDLGLYGLACRTNGNREAYIQAFNSDGTAQTLRMFALGSGAGYLTGPSRAYNASNTSDIATIGTLDQYGPMVRTTGNQEVAGNKTFINTPKVQSTFPEFDLINTNLDRDATPSATQYALTFVRDKNAAEVGSYGIRKLADGSQDFYIYHKIGTSRNATLNFKLSSSEAYITAPTRAYNASNTSDVATIGTLDAYSPMVRTSGNQTISGEKTLSTWLTIRAGHDRANVKIHNSRFNDFETSQSEALLQLFNDSDQYVAGISVEQSSSNYRVVYLSIRKADGTIKKIQLGDSA